MFPSSNVSGIGHPVADTMDMLQPWMLAAIAGLLLLMIILAVVARRKSRKPSDDDIVSIPHGEDRVGAAATMPRKSQAERQGTRSARGEEPVTGEERTRRTSDQPTGKIDAVAGTARSEKAREERRSSSAGSADSRRSTEGTRATRSTEGTRTERSARGEAGASTAGAAAGAQAKKAVGSRPSASASEKPLSRDEMVKRAAERKKNRGKSKGSHAK